MQRTHLKYYNTRSRTSMVSFACRLFLQLLSICCSKITNNVIMEHNKFPGKKDENTGLRIVRKVQHLKHNNNNNNNVYTG